MTRVPVASLTMSSVSYSSDLRILDVEFRSHSVYRYFDVSPDIYHKLMAADSKGRFFNASVRNCFRHQEIIHSSACAASAG
jgi:hypothetical protein